MSTPSMIRTSFLIGVIIAVIHPVIVKYADAFWVNDTVVSSGQSPPLRSLRLPVVAEEPPKCLPPDDQYHGKNYCWYILKNTLGTEVHSGMLIRSNSSDWGWYVTLEHMASVSDMRPTDVGVWAEGRTRITTTLPTGIILGLDFFVPRIGKWGGKKFFSEKRIEFNIELKTTVVIPYMGTVKAKGADTAIASVPMEAGKNRIAASVTAMGKAGTLESEIVFLAEVSSIDLKHWNYDCDIEVLISGKKNGFEFIYEAILPIFHQKSY
ncbi:hypothetical protein FOZ61_007062 [Perkinsus olseni]|uniref:Uncharacterized protein n=1 Tax=Perkinsus olseni TaxID=32597 RepID=A0A7J6LK65_PEROL|nr:hypothetical protein FOZ61_007062 [Perkinsus olseni]KAF4659682.1 hypothetical protein FOL46_006513 [Perkinsus olseni]